MEPVEGAGLGHALQRPLVENARIDPPREIGERRERAVAAHRLDMLDRRPPDILERRQRVEDVAVPHQEIDARAVHHGRRGSRSEPLRLAAEHLQLVGIADIERHRGGQELDRIVGLEIGGLVGDERIGGGVRFVEAIAGELGHQLENIIGLRRLDALGLGARHEALLLRIHLRLDLLAHGAAQEIGFAQRIARQDLGDLHHLLLIDDDAVGLLEDRLEQGWR